MPEPPPWNDRYWRTPRRGKPDPADIDVSVCGETFSGPGFYAAATGRRSNEQRVDE
jgi:hypothetical protein